MRFSDFGVNSPPCRNFFYAFCLLIVFTLSAIQKFSLGPIPFFNPDGWGYIGPALYYLADGQMPQIQGRNIFYPSLLALFIKLNGGSIFGIPYWQHGLFLLSGVFFFLIWFLAFHELPKSKTKIWLVPILGLLLLAIYLLNGKATYYSQNIRPESIFPLFALGQILALQATIILSPKKSFYLSGACLLAATLFGMASMSLRPAWGLALSANLLVMFYCLFVTKSQKLAWSLGAALILGLAVWSATSHYWKKHSNWKPDTTSELLLPRTLLTVHARWIVDSHPAREDIFWKRFQEVFWESQKHVGPYQSLGYNPDYIFFQSDVWNYIKVALQEERELYFDAYLGAWREHPLGMAAKVFSQVWIALSGQKNWIFTALPDMKNELPKFLKILSDYAAFVPEKFQDQFDLWLKAMEKPELFKSLLGNLGINLNIPAKIFSLLISVFLLLECTKFLCIRMNCKVYYNFHFPISPYFWFYILLSYIFLVSIIHSFDIGRYGDGVSFLYLLCPGACMVQLSLIFENLLMRRDGVKNYFSNRNARNRE